MHQRLFRLISVIFLCFLSFISLSPVQAADEAVNTGDTVISLEVTQQTVAQGEQFEVLVKIDSEEPTRGAQFSLSFDPRLVQVIGVKKGDYYASFAAAHGGETYFIPGTLDNETGVLKLAAVAMLGAADISAVGTGTLAIITVESTAGKTVETNSLFAISDIKLAAKQEKATSLKTYGYFAQSMNGVHLICGAVSTMYGWYVNGESDGTHVADYLNAGYSIRDAWCRGVDVTCGSDVTLRVLAEDTSYFDDYVWGVKSGPVSDIIVDDYYVSYDYKSLDN